MVVSGGVRASVQATFLVRVCLDIPSPSGYFQESGWNCGVNGGFGAIKSVYWWCLIWVNGVAVLRFIRSVQAWVSAFRPGMVLPGYPDAVLLFSGYRNCRWFRLVWDGEWWDVGWSGYCQDGNSVVDSGRDGVHSTRRIGCRSVINEWWGPVSLEECSRGGREGSGGCSWRWDCRKNSGWLRPVVQETKECFAA